MITANQALRKYGAPSEENNMTVWDVPANLEMGKIPKRLYCNKDLINPLEQAFTNLISRGVIGQLESWDGCFNIRTKRGGTTSSLHSWGIAVDVNAASNRFGQKPSLSPEFVACFEDAGFEWGGRWTKPDGMHFQLKELPA